MCRRAIENIEEKKKSHLHAVNEVQILGLEVVLEAADFLAKELLLAAAMSCDDKESLGRKYN